MSKQLVPFWVYFQPVIVPSQVFCHLAFWVKGTTFRPLFPCLALPQVVRAMWAFAGGNAPTSSSWATRRRVSGAPVNARQASAQTMAPWQEICEAGAG